MSRAAGSIAAGHDRDRTRRRARQQGSIDSRARLASTAGRINARAGNRVNGNSTGRIARTRTASRTVSARHRCCALCGNATCRACRHVVQ
ncbi:hypothetical protein D3C72_1411190 [compost metagenome]